MRIGTRGSRLALTQTEMIGAALRAAHPGIEIETIVIKTDGDWRPQQGEVRLSETAGGKGLYVQNIEECLRTGHVDIGVHSLKDVPTPVTRGFALDHFLPRGDARDAFISPKAETLDALPAGAIVGTSSVRRQSVILHRRPDLKVVTFRGNVDTRLEKLRAGQVDAIILAAIGLKRLGHESAITSYIEPEIMLPAGGQGSVVVETRQDDAQIRALLDPIGHPETRLMTEAERELLAVLEGSCATPIGSYAVFSQPGTMRLRGFVATLDGTEMYHVDEHASVATVAEAQALGRHAGQALRALVPDAIYRALVA
ncbi:MAG: hydroxymethylbilane synthase [Rhodospirillales bacterium]|nr:hydroxymethylbilane synthase [Alphaproteobacteria bacterium]MCB9986506.1 hydroxymethylbilane synthase [Rhodospirillales bacterium]USO08609.1 MAG: hydroxymethylbilane synthase [Rhodospirillales bacterium]